MVRTPGVGFRLGFGEFEKKSRGSSVPLKFLIVAHALSMWSSPTSLVVRGLARAASEVNPQPDFAG